MSAKFRPRRNDNKVSKPGFVGIRRPGQVGGRLGGELVEVGWAANVPGHPCIAGGSGRLPRLSRRLRDLRLRQNDNVGADLHALVEIAHVVVGEADAAARHLLADGGRIVGAVYAVFGAAEIHRARSERIAGAAGGHAR